MSLSHLLCFISSSLVTWRSLQCHPLTCRKPEVYTLSCSPIHWRLSNFHPPLSLIQQLLYVIREKQSSNFSYSFFFSLLIFLVFFCWRCWVLPHFLLLQVTVGISHSFLVSEVYCHSFFRIISKKMFVYPSIVVIFDVPMSWQRRHFV